MRLVYDLGNDDLVAFADHHATHSPMVCREIKQLRWLAGVGVVVGLLLVYFHYGDPDAKGRMVAGLCFVVMGVSAIVAYPRWFRKQYRRKMLDANRPRKTPDDQTRTTIELDDGYLKTDQEYGTTTLKLSLIDRFEQTPEHGFIYVSPITANIIPRRKIVEGDYDAFVTQLRSSVDDDTGFKAFNSVTRKETGCVTLSQTLPIWLIAAALGIGLYLHGQALDRLTDAVGQALDTTDLVNRAIILHTEAGLDYPSLSPDDPLIQTRQILITEEINERTAKDVVRRLFYMDVLDPQTPIDLYISTQGGWSDSAFTIIDAIRSLRAPVHTYAIGGCYSAGTMILVSATGKRYATPNAILAVHINNEDSTEPYSAEPIEKHRDEQLFRSRARLPKDWYPMIGDRTYYLSAEDALEFGLIDAIRGDTLGFWFLDAFFGNEDEPETGGLDTEDR